LVASITKESFYEFVKEFWSESVAELYVDNWHIEYLCNEFQKVAERVFLNLPKEYDLVINVSPGSTKSVIFSIMSLPWIWARKPSARFIGASYSNPLSLDLSRKSRDIIKSVKYRKCFPYITLKKDQDAKGYFANTKGGGRFATSVGGTVTGFHAHFLGGDDLLNPAEALSEVELKSANTWLSDTLLQRKVNQTMTPFILIMQRLHQDDATMHTINLAKSAQRSEIAQGNPNAKLKVRHICIPAELTENIKPKELTKYYKNNLMDPVRLPTTVLNEKKAAGDYMYSGQYLQHPVPLGGGMFKTDLFDVVNPPYPMVRLVRYWDKAGTQGGGCYTVGLLMGIDKFKKYWVLDVIRVQLDSARRENVIKQTANIDGRNVIVGIEQEPGSGGKESAENTVRNLAGFKVYVERPTGDKAFRADPYSVQVNNNNVGMKPAEWNLDYINELKYFPLSTYKDQVDSSSGAFNKLVKGGNFIGALR